MDFAFTEEQEMIAETVQSFFRENATSKRTRAAMTDGGIDRELWSSFCGELGLAGVALPEDMGGAGLGMVEFAIVAEAAGAHVSAIPMLGLTMATQALAAGGSDAQREAWLERLTSGEAIAAFGTSDDLNAAGDTLSGTVNFVAHGSSADVLVIA
ncbi:MAG: acyl-CoA dehydrogenase family protein, partial [Marinomonas sp.]